MKATPQTAPPAGPAKYNSMAPPTTAYTADMAVALATAAMEGNAPQAPVSVWHAQPCRGVFCVVARTGGPGCLKKLVRSASLGQGRRHPEFDPCSALRRCCHSL